MKSERYSIEVEDDCVVIHGYLTMREAFDFLSFFDQQGFTCIKPGYENSTLFLMKENYTEEKKDDEEKDQKNLHELLLKERTEDCISAHEKYADLIEANDGLKYRISVLENIIDSLKEKIDNINYNRKTQEKYFSGFSYSENSKESFSKEEYFETCYEEEKNHRHTIENIILENDRDYIKLFKKYDDLQKENENLCKMINYYRYMLYESTQRVNIPYFPLGCF